MAERLARITRETEPQLNPFRNRERARILEQHLPEQGSAPQPGYLWTLANELLVAGRTADSIARLEQLEMMMRSARVPATADVWKDLRTRLGIAHLRRAEEDNCVMHHNPQSCLFPISGTGVHGEQRGARAAFGVLSSLLEQNPGELQARWLLNIAAMTLGEYPQKVPSRWLLAPELFRSEQDFPRFPEVAGRLGLDVDDLSGGVIADDFDGDGLLDLALSSMGLHSPLRFFRNHGDGSFTERTLEAGLEGLTGGLNLVQADYDNDGMLDILVLRGAWMSPAGNYPNSLLRNLGHGAFEDVTEQAGLLSYHPTQTGTWLDFDGDGWLDLFVGNEAIPDDPHPSELYHNRRDGTFLECSRAAGLHVNEFVKAVVSGDMDNDGRPDLYLSIKGSANRLYRNDGPTAAPARAAPDACPAWKFTELGAAAGVTEPIHSFPAMFWDYDNDGWEDIFVSGFLIDPPDVPADYLGLPHKGELPRLYRNDHTGRFSDLTRPARLSRLLLAMGSNHGDLDNDGWLDLYLGTGDPDLGTLLPNRALRNDGGRAFLDVTTASGMGHLQKGHGVAFADLDNDGDQDVYAVMGGAYEADRFRNALFENPGHGSRWLKLRLEGVRSNRSAIGARIRVVARTPAGERSIHRTVRSGGSFGASPLRQEIGLGDAVAIDRVEIRWPAGGVTQVIRGLEPDRAYAIKEGETQAAPLPLRSFRLGGEKAAF
jgi:hypothetical protein